MQDLPGQQGKMCNWPHVKTVDGAYQVLEKLSQKHAIYIATNAADSSAQEIEQAFARVGLSQFISGYFCRANLGLNKSSPAFYQAILTKLKVPAELAKTVTMIGDSYDKDIAPAIAAGLNATWLQDDSATKISEKNNRIKMIPSLKALLTDTT